MSKKIYYILFSLITLSLVACDAESDELFLDEVTEDYQLYDYYVDSNGNEGIVARIYNSHSSSKRYIIVISSDEAYLSWGPMDLVVYDCDSLDYRAFYQPEFGMAMLQCMKYIGIDRFPAQAWCDKKNASAQYPYGGSWHLPTKQEIEEIFSEDGSRLTSINNALYLTGGTLINEDDLFWTCLEDYDGFITIGGQSYDYDKANRAVITTIHNSTLSNKDNWIKKNKHHVRAVKYIYYRY